MKAKKIKFSLDVSGLSNINISKEEGKKLLKKAFLYANLLNRVTVLENVKSGDFIPLLDFSPIFASGGCGYSDNNNIVLTDKAITTKLLKSDVTMCPSSLAGTSYEVFLPEGANEKDFDVLDLVKEYMAQRYAKAIQKLCLTGVSGTGSIDGLVTLAYDSTDVVEVEGTAPTSSDALDKLFAIYAGMKSSVLSADAQPIIIVGMDWLRMAALQSYNDNRAMYNFVIDDENGFTLPTTSLRVQGYDELNGTFKAIAGSAKHLIVGTDLKDDLSTLDVWYSEDNREIRSRIQFRLGCQIVFDSDFVRYKVQS